MTLNSISVIERQFNTGEMPVLVKCSDGNAYICKYMRSTGSAFKLANELIGAMMVREWGIQSPDFSFVKIQPEHWTNIFTHHSISAPAFGYKRIEDIIDITPSTYIAVNSSINTLTQLLKIALFDFWIANEDRTINNSNLLYSPKDDILISIDYGGILNTGSYVSSMSQLTVSDSILYADIFRKVVKTLAPLEVTNTATALFNYYSESINKCKEKRSIILDSIPTEWNIQKENISKKLEQLFEQAWTENVWKNFIGCINEVLNDE